MLRGLPSHTSRVPDPSGGIRRDAGGKENAMRSTVIAIALALVTAPAEAQEAIPAATVAAIKDATVFIRTKIESQMVGPAMSGSGFLIRTEGTTGYIITNAHVIIPPSGRQMFRKR